MMELAAGQAAVGDALCILFRERNTSYLCLFGRLARDIDTV